MKQVLRPIIMCIGLVLPTLLHAQLQVRPFGVQINVTNMSEALKFYTGILDFDIEKGDSTSQTVLLKPGTGSDVILLNKVPYLLPAGEKEAKATLTLQVNNLDSSIVRLKAKGVDFEKYQKRKEGVGYAIFLDDPFETRISIMHETVVENPHFAEPRVYNYGFYVPDMNIARNFFTSGLGFVVRSEKYLPLDLPLGNKDKSFAFMLHTRSGTEAIHYNSADNEHIVILFKCEDISKSISELVTKSIKLVTTKVDTTSLGKTISFYDPFGYISKLVEVKPF